MMFISTCIESVMQKGKTRIVFDSR